MILKYKFNNNKMKLKKVYLLLSLLFISNLINVQSSEITQLFDEISKDSKDSLKNPSTNNGNRMNSLFGPSEEKEPVQINFSQKNEKATSMASLFSSNIDETKNEEKLLKKPSNSASNQENAPKSNNSGSIFGQIAPGSASTNKEPKATSQIQKESPIPVKALSNNQKAVLSNNQKAVLSNNQKTTPSNNQKSNLSNQAPTSTNQRSTSGNSQESALSNNKKSALSNNQKLTKNISEALLKTNSQDLLKYDSEALLKNIPKIKNNSKPKAENEKSTNKKLEKQVINLIQMNERLMNRMKSHNKSHKIANANHEKILNFLQTHENEITSIKTVQNNEDVIENTLSKKDQEIKQLFRQTQQFYGDLQNKFQRVNSQMHQFKSEEKKKFEDLSTNNVSVKDNLNVVGDTNLNNINANEIDLGQLKLGSNNISFRDNSAVITLGEESIPVIEIFNSMKSFRKLMDMCGENFEFCIQKEQELHEKQFTQQKEILESLKNLKAQTAEILNNHRKRLR